MEKELLNNGISYFLGPLLNWTLTGVIRVLLTEIHNKKYGILLFHSRYYLINGIVRYSFVAPIHLEVLRTLLDSTSCPKSVLRLSAAAILRTFPPGNSQEQRKPAQFDPLRRVAMQALGLPNEGK
ncbi:hypothetical protein PHLCEN_2v567 [Hermanssonia centrifuga]|uniref:Uncharacterized protein n=1 Tax=Hermanssonia centrifuga TaxID=98765 RepID=A0A2R6S5I5_9APHY|nr:hypothetical protein PHLCEN_2v567 [Hermanssonia centrifuga]